MSDHEAGGFKRAANKVMDTAGGMMGKAEASLTGSAETFVENAAISDRYEIEAGELARGRAKSQAVREAAEKMVRDHTDSSEKLKQAASPKGISVPSELDGRRRSMIDHLREAPDNRFDETYLDQQVLAHEEAVSLMHHFRDEGDDDGLRQFAAQVAPVIEGHLETMKQLRKA